MSDNPMAVVVPPAAAAYTNPNAGIGTATPLASNTATYQEQVALLRSQGAQQSDIDEATQIAIANGRQRGNSEADIQTALGINDPTRAHEIMRTHAIPSLQTFTAPPAEGIGQSFKAGMENTAGGLAWRQALPEYQLPADAGFTGELAYAGGTLLGSLADAATGAAMGAGMGIAAGLPTGPGVAISTPTMATLGAFTLPAVRREAYMQALLKGQVQDWGDFARREASITWEGVKAAVVARYTAGAGAAAERIGGPAFMEELRKVAAETAAMTGLQSGLDGQLPDWHGLAVGAATILGVHAGSLAARMTGGAGRVVMSNLADNWVKTGEDPAAAAQRALHDEGLYQRLSLPKPAEPPPASSETPVEKDVFVVGRETPEHPVTPAPDVVETIQHLEEGPEGLPRGEIPPDEPTEFEKGQT